MVQCRHSNNEFPDVFRILDEVGAMSKIKALQSHEHHTEEYRMSVCAIVCCVWHCCVLASCCSGDVASTVILHIYLCLLTDLSCPWWVLAHAFTLLFGVSAIVRCGS